MKQKIVWLLLVLVAIYGIGVTTQGVMQKNLLQKEKQRLSTSLTNAQTQISSLEKKLSEAEMSKTKPPEPLAIQQATIKSFSYTELPIRDKSIQRDTRYEFPVLLEKQVVSTTKQDVNIFHDCIGAALADTGSYTLGKLICFGKNTLGYILNQEWHTIDTFTVDSIAKVQMLTKSTVITSKNADKLLLSVVPNPCLGQDGLCITADKIHYVVDLSSGKVDKKVNSPPFFGFDSFFWNENGTKALVQHKCIEGCPDIVFSLYDLEKDTSRALVKKSEREQEFPLTSFDKNQIQWSENSVVIYGKKYSL